MPLDCIIFLKGASTVTSNNVREGFMNLTFTGVKATVSVCPLKRLAKQKEWHIDKSFENLQSPISHC